MHRKSVILILLAAVVFAVAATLASRRGPSPMAVRSQWSSRPNVVLIIIDTLRQDKLGSYGFPKATSPELDFMAERGVRFDRVIAQSSWTRPSIGSLLTSQYPRTLGIYKEKDQVLADDFVTLAEALQGAGYTTLGATANANINTSFNFDQGFDNYVDSTVLLRWMRDSDEATPHGEKTLQSARQIFDSLLAQAQEHGSPPYYLQANVMEVHEHHDERMDLSDYEAPFSGDPSSRYLAAIRLVSAEIERFRIALSALPGFERTLFVIVSDHGEGLSDHAPVEDSAGHGRLLYESQVLVPLILYATDDSLPRGKVVATPSRLLDLMPTLLDYLGLDTPTGIAGTSMMGAVDNLEPPHLPEHFVAETELRSSDVAAIYGPGWEYIEHRAPHAGTDPRELQDPRRTERGTKTNQLEAHPEVGVALQAYLQEWENAHPKADPTAPAKPLRGLEEEQLRALGYLD
jgi:arylsulfatase